MRNMSEKMVKFWKMGRLCLGLVERQLELRSTLSTVDVEVGTPLHLWYDFRSSQENIEIEFSKCTYIHLQEKLLDTIDTRGVITELQSYRYTIDNDVQREMDALGPLP